MPVTHESLAIDLHDIAKTYGKRVHALRGVEMRVNRGEVFGLLGPNGAGKSTLVKIIMTVIHATRASGTVLGERVGHKRTLARVGYLPEHHRFPPYLSGRQVVEFYAALCGVDRATRKRRAAELLDLVGMSEAADARIRTYSKGMMQRIGMAQALANAPELVVLDEPTDGVDPGGRRDIRDILLRLRDEGKTVFVNSHLLSELEMICDRVAILVSGRVVRQGTLDELTLATQRYEVQLPQDTPPDTVHRALADVFIDASSGARPPTMAHGSWYDLRDSVIYIATTDPDHVQPIIDALRGARITIVAVRRVRQSLEDLFMAATASANADNTEAASR